MAPHFHILPSDGYHVLHVESGKELMEPAMLGQLSPPASLLEYRHQGMVLSGRAPIWLYSYLMHWAHPFAWIATYDPRLNGAVVVSRHVPDAPAIGQVIPMPPPEKRQAPSNPSPQSDGQTTQHLEKEAP